MDDGTRQAWRREFDAATAAIPADWVWTDPDDGWQGINPGHSDSPLVQHYAALCHVGYARGWL